MTGDSLVSILMTAYNRESYIADAIESVLASTYQNWELIIVDDCSKDSTVAIAKSYSVKDKRIKVYINEKNLGDYPNRNKAASYAKGEYIMYCDSDDQIYKDTIEKGVAAMEQFPQANYGLNTPLKIKDLYYLTSRGAIRKHFFETPIFMYGPGATIIRNSFFRNINGFPTKYGPANDMYYHLRVASSTEIVLLPFQLVSYRRHDGQELNNHYSYLYNNYLYLQDALQELNLPLAPGEIKYLMNKNKRRFITNVYRYFIKTQNAREVGAILKKTRFSAMDFMAGAFHLYFKKPVA